MASDSSPPDDGVQDNPSCSTSVVTMIVADVVQLNSMTTQRSTQRWRLLSRAVRSKTYEWFEDEGSEMPSSGISSAGSSSSGLSNPYYYPYRSTMPLKPGMSSSPPVSPESIQGDSSDIEFECGLESYAPLKPSASHVFQQQPYGLSIKTYGFMKYVLHRASSTTSASDTSVDSDDFAILNEKWIVCKWNADVVEENNIGFDYRNMSLHLKLVENRLTFQDLAGFDNSGNVRIWPCEELLAYLVTFGILKDKVEKKVVLEIGAGMTALAALTLAHLNACRRLYLTDGNRRCVKNIETIVDRNFARTVDTSKLHLAGKQKMTLQKDIHVQQLRWGIVSDYQHLRGKVEVILGADCLFVQRSHADLLETIDALLVANTGSAFLLAPRRGNTLQEWIDLIRKDGRFSINLFESFCSRFASLYQELYKQNPYGWSHDAFFPFLVVMTRNICDLGRTGAAYE